MASLPTDVARLTAMCRAGAFAAVVDQAAVLLERFPGSSELWNLLGLASHNLGRLTEAERAFRMTARLRPDLAEAHNNLAIVLRKRGKLDQAVAGFARALECRPDHAPLHYNLGNTLHERGDREGAAASFRRAIAIRPDYAEAHVNLGNLLAGQGEYEAAVACYRQALRSTPDDALVHARLGDVLKRLRRRGEAAASYRRALARRPVDAHAHVGLGQLLRDQGDGVGAMAHFREALRLRPGHVEALHNLGIVQSDQGLLADAAETFRRVIALRPDFATAHFNLASALKLQGMTRAAIDSFRRGLEIEPGNGAALSDLIFQQLHHCDWTAFDRFAEVASWLGIEGMAVPLFNMLAFEDDPERQARRARLYVRQALPRAAPALAARPRLAAERLRLGYFSADFHDHATMHLLAGLLREHDRERFDVHVYSYGRNRDGTRRKALAGQVDHFVDVADLSDRAVVALARGHGLDVAIDLKGYTRHGRSQLFAHRLAPVQIGYLGYPGTSGADFFDYLIADAVVVPDAELAHYSETVIHLPHSYQPNDDRRAIAPARTTRARFGLPETGFVFCCFNQSYKIGPREWAIWMRLLQRVDGSVLWLLRSNKWAEANLRRAAREAGVDPARLVFAGRLDQAEHLERHRHADLFVDTFNVNAHTTASDALWAGLPVVTRIGRQFAARVAASLLTAVGLPELIAESEVAYEALILDLATDPARLAGVRARLAANRLTAPLFDTVRYTRDFERALMAVASAGSIAGSTA